MRSDKFVKHYFLYQTVIMDCIVVYLDTLTRESMGTRSVELSF